MFSLFLLEDYNFIFSNIPPNKIKVCVLVDVVFGYLFSLLLAIISLLALLLAACISGFYYYRAYKLSDIKEVIVSREILDKMFVINKLLEISLLLIPCVGFLGLFLFKVHSSNKNSSWERGLYANASMICLPMEIFDRRLIKNNLIIRV